MYHASKCCGVERLLRSSTSIRNVRDTLRFDSISSTSPSLPVVAIRREDYNPFERRAPLSPQQTRKLVQDGIQVIIQPSSKRAYSEEEYKESGAIIQEDISSASLILGVKQVPIEKLIPDKTYAFFSHTIKAQEANMPLLDAILTKNIRLIDYEKITGSDGMRIVAFGKYAGFVGMTNILHGLGLRLLALGHDNPFLKISAAHHYQSTHEIKLAVHEVGKEILKGRLPRSFGPLVFLFTGSGNVSKGAEELFDVLPHVVVSPEGLISAVKKYDSRTVISCRIRRGDYLKHVSGGHYNSKDFAKNPQSYISTFAKVLAPLAHVIVNGIYWSPGNPRLITTEDAKSLLLANNTQGTPGCPDLPHRLIAIADISADVRGSIEINHGCTSIEHPFEVYNPKTDSSTTGISGDGVLMMSIDNLPTQLPRESTDYFGRYLLPLINPMLQLDSPNPTCSTNALNFVRKAIICAKNSLTDNFQYINDLRAQRNALQLRAGTSAVASLTNRKVLLLGTGMVSGPLVEYLMRDKTISVTCASMEQDTLKKYSQKYSSVYPVLFDVQTNPKILDQLISDHSIVISLLPYKLHPEIAERCLVFKKNLVTASYVSSKMNELSIEAEKMGLTFIQEVGLDPGIDHILAADCVDAVQEQGGKVVSFESYCGGLPAPEFSDNPLRYKFSWNPAGVLMAIENEARFLRDGKVVHVSRGDLMDSSWKCDTLPAFNLEIIPNRNSLEYIDHYKLIRINTMIRGTYRFSGFTSVARSLHRLGLFGYKLPTELKPGTTTSWSAVLNSLLDTKNLQGKDLDLAIASRLKIDPGSLDFLPQLGIIADAPVYICNTLLDTTARHLQKTLSYGPGERDLVILTVRCKVVWPNGQQETIKIELVEYGESNGHSAMAKTVGLPTAMAAKILLDGEITQKGAVTPVCQNLYQPLMKQLLNEKITWRTTSTLH